MAARQRIDRSSFEPPYAQLARTLRAQIAAGEYRPGDRLPSEAALCDAFDVSPMTVRRAVRQLVRDSIAVAEQGRGTFVRAPELTGAAFDLASLRRQLDDPAMSVRVVEARIVSPSPRVCAKLAVAPGDRVISIRRLLSRGEEVAFYHAEALVFDPARPLVEAELGVTSLRHLFSGGGGGGGSDVKHGQLELHASTLTAREAGYLHEAPGTAAWVLEHHFFDFENRPLSWGRFVCRFDRLRFTATVGIADDAEGAG